MGKYIYPGINRRNTSFINCDIWWGEFVNIKRTIYHIQNIKTEGLPLKYTVEHQIIHIKFSHFSWGRPNSGKLHVLNMDGGDSHLTFQ